MKRKSLKRSILNKHEKHLSNSLTTVIDATTISPDQVDLGTGTVHLDSHGPCLKANLTLKSQKVLKRDLLRCSDQRPSLLGSHTLQPPRIHHGFQQRSKTTLPSPSSSADYYKPKHRHSLSMNSRKFYATIDRIGPWPDISISRLRSDGNELLRPLKNFRNLKNPRVFSPKYYAGLNENTSKFKFYSSTRNYIDEYRKQKGYSLGATTLPLTVRLSAPVPPSDDGQFSGLDTLSSSVVADFNSNTTKDRGVLSMMDLSFRAHELSKSTNSLLEYSNTPPSIPSVTKIFSDPHHVNYFPTIAMRNGHLRQTRHPPHHSVIAQQSQHQQSITLPSLTASSLHYANSMNSIEKAYSNSQKPSTQNQPKLFFIDDRNRKRYGHVNCVKKYKLIFFTRYRISKRFNSDSEVRFERLL